MAGGYSTPTGDEYEYFRGLLQTLSRRLSELEAPTGTSINSLVAQVQQAIADIDTTVIASIAANSYTKSEIDSKIASPGAIAPTTVTTSGTVSVGGQLLDPDAATFNITGPRLTVWVETATGRLGNTASTRRYKTNERPTQIDPLAVLSIEPRMFHYIAEIRKRDDPTFEQYVGPEYVVADEVGLMAEDLHEAGLSHLVYYEEVDGEMVPASVDYVMWAVTLQVALRHVAAEVTDLRTIVTDLTQLVTDLAQRVAALEPNGDPT